MLDADAAAAPGTAEWWLIRLGKQLAKERPDLDQLHAYDIGEHPLPSGHMRARESFQRFQRMSRTNFTGLVTEAVMDRLDVGGFRMGGQSDASADQAAQRIWQANQMDAEVGSVLHDALVMRRSYVCVGPSDDVGGGVLLTGEDPRQVAHACDPANRRRVVAALKTWCDDIDGMDHAVVYLPDTVHYFIAEHADADLSGWQPSRWSVDESEFRGGVAANPAAPLVPVVPVVNRPEKRRTGFGEFEDVCSVQDRINQTVLDRMVVAAAQAFRQRWGTGITFKDEKGNDVQPFEPGADLFWWVVDEKASFGDFAAADIRQIIDLTKSDTEILASISRTPPYYLLGEMVNISGDALTAADTGATAKARSRQRQFGEALEQVMRVAHRVLGLEAPPDIETIWADAERRDEAKAADAAVKKQAVGVPWRQNMEDLGYSPQQIERMETDRAADAFLAGVAQPVPPSAPTAAEMPAEQAGPVGAGGAG